MLLGFKAVHLKQTAKIPAEKMTVRSPYHWKLNSTVCALWLDEGPHWKAGIDDACTMDLPEHLKTSS